MSLPILSERWQSSEQVKRVDLWFTCWSGWGGQLVHDHSQGLGRKADLVVKEKVSILCGLLSFYYILQRVALRHKLQQQLRLSHSSAIGSNLITCRLTSLSSCCRASWQILASPLLVRTSPQRRGKRSEHVWVLKSVLKKILLKC